MEPESLTQEALGPAADDGVADAFRRDDAESGLPCDREFRPVHQHTTTGEPPPLGLEAREVACLFEALGAPERQPRGRAGGHGITPG